MCKLEKEAGHSPADAARALDKAFERGDRIPIGLFCQDHKPTCEDTEPSLRHGPLVRQDWEDSMLKLDAARQGKAPAGIE